MIISDDGYIVTNNHVEDAKEDGIKVILHDRKEYKAKLSSGRDPDRRRYLKIEATNLPSAHFGSSDEAQIGQ